MTAPLYERLKSYAEKNRISFAMPGHKNGRGLKKDLVSLDVTELDETENLHHPGEYVKEAERLLSLLYGSEKSYILTGGSTAAIQAMICGGIEYGKTLLASADCHTSVINTCALLGIKIKLFHKEIIEEFNIPKGTGTLKEYLTDDIGAVILTSPNYYGICSDIENIAKECHKMNIPLLVDEAHGAHFPSYEKFPVTAVKYADAVCQSAHKTLNAMNGAAYLHVNGEYINRDRLEKALHMFQSSSPSYVIAATADTAREEIANGTEWMGTYNLCCKLRKTLAELGMNVLENDDMTRLVINFFGFELTGFEVGKMLSERGIDIEMADLLNIVLIVTPSNTKEDIECLIKELTDIAASANRKSGTVKITIPPVCDEVLEPHKAFFSKQTDIKLEDASGKISCSTVVPYPPGIPVIYTGERIRKSQIEYIESISQAGAEITGLNEGKITVSE